MRSTIQLEDEYYSVLDVAGNGIIGYVDIPKIDVELPIYHGTSEQVLNMAVGHLEGSSLPIGGEEPSCGAFGAPGSAVGEAFHRSG